MAVAFDGETILSGDQTASGTWTFAGKTTAGSDRVGILRFNCPTISVAAITGVTWGGVAMTSIGTTLVFASNRTLLIYYIVAPATGSSDIVITYSSGTPAGEYVVSSYNGADQADPIGDVQTATGTSTTPSVAVTTVAGDMALDWMGIANVISSVGAGQTSEFLDTTGGSYRVGASREAAAGASVTMSWTTSSGAWSTIGFALNQAAAPAAGNPWYCYAQQT